ncbi:unnamed protein product [Arabidopsis lyrata]|nr:unnamed protein product [Arabidopsis lyrata]
MMRSSTQEPTMEKIMGEKQQPRSSQVGFLTKFYLQLRAKPDSAYPRRPLSLVQSRRSPRSCPPSQRILGIHSQLKYRAPRRRISPKGETPNVSLAPRRRFSTSRSLLQHSKVHQDTQDQADPSTPSLSISGAEFALFGHERHQCKTDLSPITYAPSPT